MIFEYLETERLKIRKLDKAVYQYIFTHYSEDEIKAFLGVRSEEEFLREKEKYEKGLDSYKKSFCYFHLIEKKTNQVIGDCGFHIWYLRHFKAEIGYSLYEEGYKKQGFMSEALRAVIRYGFEEMALHRIEAMVSPNNVPSLALMKKMNFIQEGLLRENYLFKEKFEDSLIFSLLKREWQMSFD